MKAYRTQAAADKECKALSEFCTKHSVDKSYSWVGKSPAVIQKMEKVFGFTFPLRSSTGISLAVESLRFFEV